MKRKETEVVFEMWNKRPEKSLVDNNSLQVLVAIKIKELQSFQLTVLTSLLTFHFIVLC